LTATNQGVNGITGVVDFSVANADQLFATAPTASVFADVAAQAQSVGASGIAGFDWGLPLLYGRRIFTTIEGSATPAGASG